MDQRENRQQEEAMGKKILFLGLDAAMPDLVEKFVAEGNMPNTAKLIGQGIFSRLVTVFPPLTAAAWTAIVSGAGSGTNGVPSLMVKHPGEELDHWHTSFDRNEVLCETLWDVAKRQGKKVALINWPVTFPLGAIREEDGVQLAGSLNPPFRYFYMPLWDVASSAVFSDQLLHCNQIPGRAVQLKTRPAEGWKNLPASNMPPLAFDIAVPPTYVAGYNMHVLVYASADAGYDHMLIAEEKDAAKAITDIGKNEFGPWITRRFRARDYERDGRFRFQILQLTPDAAHFKLYQSSINTAEPYSVPASLSKEVEAMAGAYMEVDDPWAFMDGWMDGGTYLEQLGMHAEWWGDATKYVLDHKEWDMAFSWVGTIDHIEHVLYSGIEPKARVYDPKKADWCMDMIRSVYKQVDRNIGKILAGVDLEETYVVLISDHGMTHLDWNPYVKEHLSRAGLLDYVLDLTTDDPSNLSINWAKTKCHPLEPCHAHIFINLKGRDPHGIVEPEDYERVQEEIIRTLLAMRNPETGEQVVAMAIKKKESGTLGIYEGPGYDRVGDVLYAWKPGYMSHPFIYRAAIKYRDGSERIARNAELYEEAVLCGNFTGVHLALPSLHDMHAVMVMGGPGVKQYKRKYPAQIIDVAPTLSKLLGIEVPKDAEGSVLYDVLDNIAK
ncbi:MAG TPA: alkaline phosphatase family protein [Clostridia bacterium]|nr:alkaline phosphatase family protein [Clostridia bacterium]